MKTDRIELLCTLGPSSLNQRTISRLDALGADIFRINLSHTNINDLNDTILKIKQYTDKPICLDTEGAQVRTGHVNEGEILLHDNDIIKITGKEIVGDSEQISLTPDFVVDYISCGDLISIDFDSALLQVVDKAKGTLIAKVVSGGKIGSNKAVTIDSAINLPVITAKDQKAIAMGRAQGIKHFALSFANGKKSIRRIRELIGEDSFLISKVESKEAIQNIDEILKGSNAILIDRGDLSREEPIDKIPFIQKLIIKKANTNKVPVYVATNLLESMVKSKKPTRAEVNDVINTLLDGANGLVLAAETAIGAFPLNCALMITKLISNFQNHSHDQSLDELQEKESFLLIEPHGSTLINRVNPNPNMEIIKQYQRLEVDYTDLLNVEQVAIGTFSPLEGFMTKEELTSVLANYRLPNGVIWPLPIVLQTSKNTADQFREGDKLALVLKGSNEIYALLDIKEIFTYDLKKMAIETYGTADESHPGVHMLKTQGSWFLGGKIELIKRLPSKYKSYELTPRQSRTIFETKGWSRVVGFHTRNVIHRAHEHIQMMAMNNFHCDGIFIHPVIGPKKEGDYEADIILKAYDLMINKYYPEGKVVLGAFQNYSRYAGPREAVFTALCRKNFGCSHFIVGRDHTGVGNYYQSDAAHKLFDALGDIGIVPIFFDTMHYCRQCNHYVGTCEHGSKSTLSISGTQGREMILAGESPPDWFMRQDISNLILDEIKNKKKVFVS